METPTTTTPSKSARLNTLTIFVFPIVLLAGIIALFLYSNGAGLNVEPAAPIERITFERTFVRPGEFEFQVRNISPQDLAIAQITINDGFRHFTMMPSNPLPRLGEAVITVPYHWVKGEAYRVALLSANGVEFTTEITAAAETATPSANTLLSFTLIGIYVGVIPVFLGMFWFPALKRLGQQAMTFLMALTAGLLVFLGIDATGEGLELASQVGGPFQGVELVGIGVVATFMLLDAVSRRQVGVGRSEAAQRLIIAFMIALGIGLHNLGEGLAIGASFSVGAAALGTFLVIGFIIQNITEGLGIIAPVLRDQPSMKNLLWLGIIGGAPAIAGAWIGGLTYSQPLAVLFLAIGAGAVFEVVYEIAKLIQKDTAKRPMPLTIFAGVTMGMLLLYVTGVVIK